MEKGDLNIPTLEQYYCKVEREEEGKLGVNTLKSRMVVKILKEVEVRDHPTPSLRATTNTTRNG